MWEFCFFWQVSESIHACIHSHTGSQSYTHTHTPVCTHTRTHACTHARTHACTHACTDARMHARTQARAHTLEKHSGGLLQSICLTLAEGWSVFSFFKDRVFSLTVSFFVICPQLSLAEPTCHVAFSLKTTTMAFSAGMHRLTTDRR